MIDRDFREIFTSQFIAITGGIIAGIFLLSITNKLELVPGLFVLIPGFLEMHGNIFGSLAARLVTLLHIKHIKPKLEHNRLVWINILASVFLLIIVALFLGIAAYLLNLYIFKSNTPILILISLIAAVIAIIVELPITVFSTFWLYKNGYDPDDIMGPYITTIGDVVSILSLFIVMLVVV